MVTLHFLSLIEGLQQYNSLVLAKVSSPARLLLVQDPIL